MERLMMIPDIRERYHCNDRTARAYMREMGIVKKNPMMVRETAVAAWEAAREQASRQEEKPDDRREWKENVVAMRMRIPAPKPGHYISRVRPQMKTAGEKKAR